MKILQIGRTNWLDDGQTLPKNMEWFFSRPEDLSLILEELEQAEKTYQRRLQFQAVLITDTVQEKTLDVLEFFVEAYGLFHLDNVPLNEDNPRGFFKRKMLRTLPAMDKQAVMNLFSQSLFSGQHGSKLRVSEIEVNPNFKGQVTYDGHVAVHFQGDFSEQFEPVCAYRSNVYFAETALEIWQEYVKTSNVTIRMVLTPIKKWSVSDITDPMVLDETDLQDPVVLARQDDIGNYAITIWAKGNGKLSVGALHWRHSRLGLGKYTLGGEQFHDNRRQEISYYFHPGDMKPPLNVYFSGYRAIEGFEGFRKIKSLNAPFLLISDPRLEGGGFYIGTATLEQQIQDIIHHCLNELTFSTSDLILSGLSMGAFGALYYSAHFNPHAVIIGKPFSDLGGTALGMKLKRPDEFETIADVLLNVTGGISDVQVSVLNQKFWDKFSRSRFGRTRFAIAYMEQDDFDDTATTKLLEHLSTTDAHVYTKGYMGRHNDNSDAINKWFITQYKKILEEGFGRYYS